MVAQETLPSGAFDFVGIGEIDMTQPDIDAEDKDPHQSDNTGAEDKDQDQSDNTDAEDKDQDQSDNTGAEDKDQDQSDNIDAEDKDQDQSDTGGGGSAGVEVLDNSSKVSMME